MRPEFLEFARSVSFWKKWAPRKQPGAAALPQRTAIAERQRRTYRASVEFPMVYVVEGRSGTRNALANDLSAGGVRILGDEDLPDGTVLDVRFTLPNDLVQSVTIEKETIETTARGRVMKKVMVPPEPFHEIAVRCTVVVAFFNTRRRKFAHGVQFVEVDDGTQEEIQRFIHIWQIRLLRERAHLRGE